MTRDQTFTILISAIGLLFIIGCSIFGLVWHIGYTSSKVIEQVEQMSGDIKSLDTKLDTHIGWHMDRRRNSGR